MCAQPGYGYPLTSRCGDDPLDFDPVPLRYRRDGWTPDKQELFIRALAETCCVEDACRRVKMFD